MLNRFLLIAFATALLGVAKPDLTGARWRNELVSIDAALHAKNYGDARSMSMRLTQDMLDHILRGPNEMYTFAVAVAFRAVAEAGMGNLDDAEWYWCVATGLFPKYRESDLSVYGDAGKILMNLTSRMSAGELREVPEQPPGDSATMEPPKIEKMLHPTCPLGAVGGHLGAPVVIRVVIGTDGIPRRPDVVSSQAAPSLVYAALEAVRTWRFSPAKINGQPVPVQFDLTVNFKIR